MWISWIWANKQGEEEIRKYQEKKVTVETKKGVKVLEKEVPRSVCGTKMYAQGPCTIRLVVVRVRKYKGI